MELSQDADDVVHYFGLDQFSNYCTKSSLENTTDTFSERPCDGHFNTSPKFKFN